MRHYTELLYRMGKRTGGSKFRVTSNSERADLTRGPSKKSGSPNKTRNRELGIVSSSLRGFSGVIYAR